MKFTILRTLVISLCFGLGIEIYAADNEGIYMRSDTNESVELSNLPSNDNYQLITVSPSPPSNAPQTANTDLPTASAPTVSDAVPITETDLVAPLQVPLPAEEQRALESPQKTTEGYLELLIKRRGKD